MSQHNQSECLAKISAAKNRMQVEALPFISSNDIEDHLNESVMHERVMAERMRQYMSRQRLTSLSGVLPAAYMYWMHYERVNINLLLAWWLSLFVVDMFSVWFTTQYLKAPRPVKEMLKWRNTQIGVEALAGVIWGATIYLFRADTLGETDRAIILTTISAVAVIAMLPFRQAVISFTIGLWCIPLYWNLADGVHHHFHLGIGILVLVISLNFYLWEASRQLVDGIEQRFHADALAQALKSAASRIHELSTRDELTGIFNRREGMNVLKQCMNSRRKGEEVQPLSLMMLDVDHFKKVNDVYGHPAGDEVLRQISRALQNSMRDADIVARIGGEEFMVVLPATVAEDAYILAQRLCESVSATPVTWGDTKLAISISIGVTEVAAGETHEHALARADAALYQAKNDGRNRAVRA